MIFEKVPHLKNCIRSTYVPFRGVDERRGGVGFTETTQVQQPAHITLKLVTEKGHKHYVLVYNKHII